MAQATGLRVSESHRRRGSRAADEARPAVCCAERLTAMLDERRLAVLIRQHGIGKPKDGEAPAKLLAAFLPKAEESKLGRILVETVILLSMHNQTDAAKILRDAAQAYKVDVDAISATVKQEFAAKEKGKANKKAAPKSAVEAHEESSGLTSNQHETSRGASKTGSAFLCPAARLPALMRCPGRGRGDIFCPPNGQRRTALAGNTWECR